MNHLLAMSLVSSLEVVGRSLGSWLEVHAVNIIVIVIGAWLFRHFGAGVMGRILSHTVRPDLYPTKTDRSKRLKTLNSLTGAVIRTGVYIIAGILIVGEINPDYTTALFASAGLVTVALGFGAKDLINDFMSGIFIITENQYRVGDVVEIAGVKGTVEDVTIRTTVLRDLDGNVHHVPNGDITVTTNKTLGFSRLNETVVLQVGTDIERTEHIINHIGDELAARPDMKHKMQQAPHVASIEGYGQGGIILKIAATVSASDKYTVRTEFYRLLYKAFAKHSIELAMQPPPAPPTKN